MSQVSFALLPTAVLPEEAADTPLLAGGRLLLLGARRSGTTWLGKIFDSHPKVLYRHEPDTVVRTRAFPDFCTDADVVVHRGEARDYLLRMAGVRTLKSAGSLPLLPKSYQDKATFQLRRAIVLGLKACEQIPPLRGWARHVAIPDLLGAQAMDQAPFCVIKSVISCGRVALYAEAMPEARILLILRHPCGQVASTMRGVAQHKFEKQVPIEEIIGLPQADRYGLTRAGLQAMSEAERHAWHWAILNEKALDDLPEDGRGRVLRYEDLCNAPVAVAHELLDFAGLAWDPQVDRFLEDSTRPTSRDRYYRVEKDPIIAMNKWRQELSAEDQRSIMAVAAQTKVGHRFLDA
jgi:hypothetical protein